MNRMIDLVTDALGAWFVPGWYTNRAPANTVIEEIMIIIIIIIIIIMPLLQKIHLLFIGMKYFTVSNSCIIYIIIDEKEKIIEVHY